MRAVSLKRQRENRQRKKVIDAMKAEGFVACVRCGRQADDPHEVLSRGRGGSITDPRNIIPLCRIDHDWVTTHPLEAHAEGLLLHSWEAK